MATRISVTAEHIKNSCHSSRNCPVALAVRDLVKDGSVVDVFSECIYIDFVRCQSPREVRDFVSQYDYHNKAQPFEFELDIDEKYLRTKEAIA